MDTIKQGKKSTASLESKNKVLDSLKQVQSFKEVITAETFKDKDLKSYSLLVKNLQDNKLKIEKNNKGEYRITRVNYDRSNLENKKDLEESLLKAIEIDTKEGYTSDKINDFIKKDLEVIKYNFNDKALNNGFLPITQNSFCDYNRNSVSMDNDNNVLRVCNPLKREIYLPKGEVESLNLKLPEQKEVEVATINTLDRSLKNFIVENDISAVEYDKSEIEADILNAGSNIEGCEERIKDIMTSEELSDKEKIQKLRDEYGTGGGSLNIKKDLDGLRDYSPGMGIMYSMDNGQVFPFTWKKVFDLYKAQYETAEVKEEIVEKVPEIKTSGVLLDKNKKQLGIFDNNEFKSTVEKDPDEINLEQDFDDIADFRDPVRLEIKKKAKFGLIENNVMGRFVLEKQPKHEKIDDFNHNQLNSVREKVNTNSLYKATLPELRSLYENYNLENLDSTKDIKGEFSRIMNSNGREYIKGAFQIRIDKIVKRMNDYDNPVQTLEDYFHSIRRREFDLVNMDIEKFKKVVSGLSTIYNHDLLSVSKKEVKSVVKNINRFMRGAKEYVVENNLDFKEIDAVLAKGFLKNYKEAIS